MYSNSKNKDFYVKHIPAELYNQITQVMPIPCVDLLVIDKTEKILMIKRKNLPAQGKWWFPGGRVFHGELRKNAALRKLKEECGLIPKEVHEMGTYDVLLDMPWGYISHAITTVFKITVSDDSELQLNGQNVEYS